MKILNRPLLVMCVAALLVGCGGGGGDSGGGSSTAAEPDANPTADYAGSGLTHVSRIVGTAFPFAETRMRDLQYVAGTWYGASRFDSQEITSGVQCLQPLTASRISTCQGFTQGEANVAGASLFFIKDDTANGAEFSIDQRPPELGGADTQNRFTLRPSTSGWATATYAGQQKPKVALLAHRYFVVMDMQAGSLGGTPYMAALDYATRYNSANTLAFQTPSAIHTQLFGLTNLNTTDYPVVMNFDFANHDGSNGFYAFLSRDNSKNPQATGAKASGALNLWLHDGTTLTARARLPLANVAKPIIATYNSWEPYGIRLVKNAGQLSKPLIVLNDVTRSVLDVYQLDGTTLQLLAGSVTPPAGFQFASAPLAAINGTLYMAAGKSVYKLAGTTPTVLAGDYFNQASRASLFTDIDVIAGEPGALLVGIGRNYTRSYNHVVADVLKLPQP